MNKLLVARCLFTFNAVGIAAGGFLADMNPTHMYNPHWPPHAKFHDGQTMAFGVFLSLASLFFVWRRSGDRQTNVLAATLIGGILYWAQAAAFAFPGVAWTDPEFLKPGESLTQFPPQLYIDIAMSVVVIFTAWLAWPHSAEAQRPVQTLGSRTRYSSPFLAYPDYAPWRAKRINGSKSTIWTFENTLEDQKYDAAIDRHIP